MSRKSLDVAEAIRLARAGVPAAAAETVALSNAFGRVLAEPVMASRDQPPFRSSAMDGYAVRRADIRAGAVLKVIGQSAAGRRFAGTLQPGEAVRIFTGAPVPDEADAVVIQENTVGREGDVELLGDAETGAAHIREAGRDFQVGEEVLQDGVRLDAWRLSLAAAAGCASVEVRKKPVVAVLCNGDELVPPGAVPGPDQIYESASAAILALITQWGAEARFIGTKGDDADALYEALSRVEADLIVTIGGASVGDHDLVKPALERLGLRLDFVSLNLKPGKPTSFGVLAGDTFSGGAHVLGMPGNPASAFVVAQLLLKPWVEAALGLPNRNPLVRAVTMRALPANGPREAYLRANLNIGEDGRLQVEAFDDQDSSLVSVFARTGALIRLPGHSDAKTAGALVDVLRLDRF